MKYLSILSVLFALVSCTVTSPDNFVSQRLIELSNSTDMHFDHLISSFGTLECEFSSAPNQAYWAAATSSLDVLAVRIEAFPMNQDLLEGFSALAESLQTLRNLEAQAGSQSSGLRCLEPDVEISDLWPPISTAFTNIIAASTTEIVR